MDSIALIPAYNEEETIEEVVSRVRKSENIVPVIIDDGSTDRTSELAKKAGAIVLEHKANRGKSEALKTGIDYVLQNYPEVRYFVVVDADMQYLPEEWSRLVDPLRKDRADYVIGCRRWKIVPFRHRVGNFVWRTVFNFFFNTKLLDTNCGFVAFKREVVEKMERSRTKAFGYYGGYIIDNAMIIQMIKSGFRVKNVPVTVIYKEKRSVKSGVRVVLGVLLFIIKEGIKYRFR